MPSQSLEEYLASLEAQRATLNLQIAGARIALGLAPDDSGAAGMASLTAGQGLGAGLRAGAVTGRIRPDEFFRMSIPEAIKAYLEIMKQPQTPKAITDGLKAGGVLSESSHFYANVLTAIKRLRAAGQVINTKTGGWGLASWYAGRSGAAMPEKPKRKGKKKVPRAKRPPVDGAAPKKHHSDYNAFMSEQRKAGKTMKEVAAAWKARKGSGS